MLFQNTFIIIPEKVAFPEYTCKINPRFWFNSSLQNILEYENNSTEVDVISKVFLLNYNYFWYHTFHFTGTSQRLCNCAPNTFKIFEVCTNGTYELIVKYEENSTTHFDGHQVRMWVRIANKNNHYKY